MSKVRVANSCTINNGLTSLPENQFVFGVVSSQSDLSHFGSIINVNIIFMHLAHFFTNFINIIIDTQATEPRFHRNT